MPSAVLLPSWAVGAGIALLIVLCVLALSRGGRDGVVGALARAVLILVGAGAVWFYLGGTGRQEHAAERRALEQRIAALAARATTPGSHLACLDALAGETVEVFCEQSLFATPAGLSQAMSYVASQWSLFADLNASVRSGNAVMEPALAELRRAIESDRYGLVAHLLATREGCTVQHCPALGLLQDARRVNANLAQGTYDFYVTHHAATWPAATPAPVAQMPGSAPPALAGATPELPPGTAAYAQPPRRMPGPDVFFPSSDSIPPVNIMTAEPPVAEPKTTGAAPQRAARHPQAKPAPPQPKPAQPKQAAPAAAPMDLNAARTGGGGTQ